MTKNEFLLKMLAKIDDLLIDHNYQKEVLNDLIKLGFDSANKQLRNDESRFANMLLQMGLCKANSIAKLNSGLNIWSEKNKKNDYIDVQSQACIFRSLFENYSFFNHLFIQNRSDEEFLVLLNIWKATSLNQRFNMIEASTNPLSLENSQKIIKEKEFVKGLIKEIQKTSLYKRNKKIIDSSLKRHKWQLDVVDKKIVNISWQKMYENTREKSENTYVYQMNSLDTHPSYYSVFQFGDLYKTRFDLNRGNTVLYGTIDLLCRYLFDFKKLMKVKTDLENIDEIEYLVDIIGKDK